uniref:O-methyltransferase domain-containing protein n=1 Tax=Aegilops tauschii subsp. strangulata TaxID=200361 RepID=A0A453QIX7_AEGTS
HMQYVLETTVYPREHERLRELRLITQQHSRPFMGSSPDQMRFFSVLLKMIGASNTVEVARLEMLSLLTTTLALPAGGKVVAIDANREYYELGRSASRTRWTSARATGSRSSTRSCPRTAAPGPALRLRVRGRGQAAVRGVPRAAAAPGARRRRHRLRQHALGRLRGDAP